MALSAVVFLGCKKERSFRGANPGDEIVFGGTAGSASGFRSSKTKGCDGDSSVLCAKMWRVIVDLPFQYGKFNAVCIIAEIVNFAD